MLESNRNENLILNEWDLLCHVVKLVQYSQIGTDDKMDLISRIVRFRLATH